MEYLDGQIVEIESVGIGKLLTICSWWVDADWCEKIEDALPSEHIVEPNKTMEQREYDLYMSLIHKYIDQIMDGNETLIRNCRGMAKKIIDEFKK